MPKPLVVALVVSCVWGLFALWWLDGMDRVLGTCTKRAHGLFGMFSFGVLLALLAAGCWRSYGRQPNAPIRPVDAWSCGALAAFYIFSMGFFLGLAVNAVAA